MKGNLLQQQNLLAAAAAAAAVDRHTDNGEAPAQAAAQ
jgi:hypothetical protein